ncbi:efflux RND transporter periplasmic adaptor subunit [Paenirhodobacter sp. CAU 1674]|jgi:membrane fusion protein (multidrug efflux system)|uniref:efflux RND transporter periplasmic adaptor subunit n=1 Tax=Paenirhodobacter sp. CAU 1674 TaxID=3032596 RepID=UPI0023DACF1A|nr:efflux RND transporter periplasmic adaptor subunit [Paenirhodobacter sp. CAU 1674]MDF2140749.1 efflux RND transporter periplasmic adaptor subunit [Paenirhodobacter sp. CAU 1674]
MIKRFIIAILLLGLIGGGIVGFNLFRAKMIGQFFATMKPAPVPVSVSEVTPQLWAPGLEAIGTAAAAQGVDLATEAAGIVREIRFKANDRIEKGQLLVQIDDRTERADLAAAEAALDLAETSLTRARELRERGVSATTTLDQAEATAVEARSTVAKLKAVLETKQLTAPFGGTIGIPQIELGQFVTAGTPYATLQDRSQMRVDFTLSEQQAGVVAPGQKVTVTSEVGDLSLAGEVTGIEPKIDANSRLVTIRASVPNAEDRLTPGQFLRVRVSLPEEEGIIALPQTVVSSNLYGDSVFVVREETPEGGEPTLIAKQVFVKLGRRSDTLVEITEGLKAGDKVVNAGQNRLSSGATVTIDNSLAPVAATN